MALAASATGEKLKPLVIGKSRQPRCFDKIKPSSLPDLYKSNKKAWMTSQFMEDWLQNLDKLMGEKTTQNPFVLGQYPSAPYSNIEKCQTGIFASQHNLTPAAYGPGYHTNFKALSTENAS